MAHRIITRRHWRELQREAAQRRGGDPRRPYRGTLPRPEGYKLAPCFLAWPDSIPVIPRDQWPERIREGKGSFLGDLRKGKLPTHSQGRTNRCWAHGSVRAVEILRLWQGQPPLLLSPDSVAYPIEGTRDRGGYPEDACAQLAKGGACAQSLWPERDLSPANADPSWNSNALAHMLLRWILPTTWEQQITAAIMRIPVAIPLDWWGHLVCQLDPVLLGATEVGIGFDNSWGNDWGDDGYGTLDEESGTASRGGFAPLSETFSPT